MNHILRIISIEKGTLYYNKILFTLITDYN